ncbi:MAG: hypothetical protein GWO02_14615 [Gammaproteobacteria bacterium]|nr:hypothetical protein [Gammaproteobacteria bacterium]
MDYDGQTQAGTPARTETEYAGVLIEGTLGRRFRADDSRYALDLFGALGLDVWTRDIRDTPVAFGLREEYRVLYGKAGAAVVGRAGPGWWARLALGVRQPLDVDEDVDEIDASNLTPGGEPSLFLSVGLRPRTGRLGLSLYYEAYRFERSGAVPSTLGPVVQPESQADALGLRAHYFF